MSKLVHYYVRNPRLLARHAKRGLSFLTQPGGVQRLRAAVGEKRRAIAGGQADDVMALAQIRRLQRKHPHQGVEMLAPWTQERAGFHDASLTPQARLRALRAAILTERRLFDAAYYALHCPGVDDLLGHYLDHGIAEGRWPNPFFDPRAYVRENLDVGGGVIDPVIHYALWGWREGRGGGLHFDPEHYLAQLDGPPSANVSPFEHFLTIGRDAGLSPVDAARRIGATLASRGTILCVVHETEVGGAPALGRIFARWVLDHTRFDVRFVALRGGALVQAFHNLAPTLVLSEIAPPDQAAALAAFAGDDVRVVYLNSVASGGFLKLWCELAPVVAHLHELPRVMEYFPAEFALILDRAHTILGGSQAVSDSLRAIGADPARLRTQHAFVPALTLEQAALAEDKPAARTALGLDPARRIVAGCGTLHWRKSPELFIEIARQVHRTHPDVAFRWIGGGPDLEECKRKVREVGLTSTVSFTGYVPDVLPHLAASDIFLLPSQEDPFPLVCLNAAQMLAPVACFQDAGGAPEVFGATGGAALPFGDAAAMAQTVRDWLDDPATCARLGAEGRARVERDFTLRHSGPALLSALREAAGLAPDVSVIVPNYNYERYLPERLMTIANQDYQDFEVILLDDASRDGSVEILRAWAETRPDTRVELNALNSGSPFAQWLRGMKLARAEQIWIAEADDSARPGLLRGLVAALSDRNVMLAYAHSVPIGEDGAELGDYRALYLDRISPGRWDTSYVATDHEEVNAALGIANCIPNASSVLFRAFDLEPEFAAALVGMRMCGDWLFYLRAVRGGLVAFVGEPHNLHRRHTGTVTHATEGSLRYFDELATVRRFVADTYRLEPDAQARVAAFMDLEMARFGVTDTDRQAEIRARLNPTSSRLPSALILTSDLGAGGGQLFAIRLAGTLAQRGNRVVLGECGAYPRHPKVVGQVDPRIPLFSLAKGVEMAELLDRFDLDLVHTSLWWADRFVAFATEALGSRPWVCTMHGCHETLLADPGIDTQRDRVMAEMIARVDTFVPVAAKNRSMFAAFGTPQLERTIDNGVDARPGRPIPRARLGLRDESLILILASRAIPDKGWAAAVDLTARLNAEGLATDLILVGEGPEADALAARRPAHVQFVGHVSNVPDYLATADIGLVPSSFVGESLPLVMLELMAQGRPVVATDLGEIPRVLGSGVADAAGIVVPLVRGRVDLDGFAAAIRRLADPEIRHRMGATARARFEAGFTVDQMAQAYNRLYREMLDRPGIADRD